MDELPGLNKTKEKHQEQKLSSTIDHRHNYNVLLMGISILLIVIISICIGYYLAFNQFNFQGFNQDQLPKTKQNNPANYGKSILSPTISHLNEYMVINGSIYKINNDGNRELVIEKSTFKNERMDISEINSYILSPDKNQLLLLVNGGFSADVLFNYNLDTKEYYLIGFGNEATWAPNSKYIAYTQRPADIGLLDLKVYDIVNNKNVDLTKDKKPYTNYSRLRWASDSNSITANYETFDASTYGQAIDKGETQILLNKQE